MRSRLGAFLAAMLVVAFSGAGVLAESAPSPVGTWEPDNKETRYKIDYCRNGSKLCVTLVWVTDKKKMPKTRPYLGKTFAAGFNHVKRDTWTGPVHFRGISASGTLRVLNPDHIRLTACKFIVLCYSMDMRRYAANE